jgi:FAD/FMN-containing dehydrogenases
VTSEVVRIANSRNGEGFVAISAEARKKFWLDRKRTAAISKHTNAFKINEDVVIPLPRMAEYTDGIERINIELSLRNKLKLCDECWISLKTATCHWASKTTPRTFLRPSCWKTVCTMPWRWCKKCVTSGLHGWPMWMLVPSVARPQPACQLEDTDPQAAGANFQW